jgi:hypothetical protein
MPKLRYQYNEENDQRRDVEREQQHNIILISHVITFFKLAECQLLLLVARLISLLYSLFPFFLFSYYTSFIGKEGYLIYYTGPVAYISK